MYICEYSVRRSKLFKVREVFFLEGGGRQDDEGQKKLGRKLPCKHAQHHTINHILNCVERIRNLVLNPRISAYSVLFLTAYQNKLSQKICLSHSCQTTKLQK